MSDLPDGITSQSYNSSNTSPDDDGGGEGQQQRQSKNCQLLGEANACHRGNNLKKDISTHFDMKTCCGSLSVSLRNKYSEKSDTSSTSTFEIMGSEFYKPHVEVNTERHRCEAARKI